MKNKENQNIFASGQVGPLGVGVFLFITFVVLIVSGMVKIPLPQVQSSVAEKNELCITDVPESTDEQVVFTLLNCGDHNVTAAMFATASYYINGTRTACTSDSTADFQVGDIRAISCPAKSTPICTIGKGCQERSINVIIGSEKSNTVSLIYYPVFMMRLEFVISKNGTFSLSSSEVEDGYSTSPSQAEPSDQTYFLRLYSAKNELLYNQTFRPEFLAFGFEIQPTEIIDNLAIPYLEDAATFKIEKLDGTPIFTLNVPEMFCNKNGICDASENYLSCYDCPSGSKDGYCDGLKDGMADPDCLEWLDPDYPCNNNGICESDMNENKFSCPADCQNWAQDGICPSFTDLKDGHCDLDCGSKDPDCAGQTGWSAFMAKTSFSLNLGESEGWLIRLTNLDSQKNRTFRLSVAGLDPVIYTLEPATTTTVPAGEVGFVELMFRPKGCALKPYIYNVSIMVTSESETRQLNATLRIKPTRTVSLSIQPESQELGFTQNTSYSMHVSNTGNVNDSYALSSYVTPEGLKIDYPPSVVVAACSSRTAGLTVLPVDHSISPGEYAIFMSAASKSDSGSYTGTVPAMGIIPGANKTSTNKNTRFCIENVWNESTAIKFTLRNCGSYDVTQADFSQTSYYIDNIKTVCTPDRTTQFNVYDTRTVTCPAGSYGNCTPSAACPTRTVKVTTVFGKADAVTYQYIPNGGS